MTVIAIPDTHFPWVDQYALDVVIDDIKHIQPEVVIQMGDLYDNYSFSSHHPTSRNITTPKNELHSARSGAIAMWQAIQAVSPESKCYQILGNHDIRIHKSIREKAPELEAIFDTLDINSLWQFEDVYTEFDYREPLELDGVVYHHGWLKLGEHMKKFLKPTVVGHYHIGQTLFMNLWDHTIWEACSGFMGDRDALAFNYMTTNTRKWEPWTTGYLIRDIKGPRFIPVKS